MTLTSLNFGALLAWMLALPFLISFYAVIISVNFAYNLLVAIHGSVVFLISLRHVGSFLAWACGLPLTLTFQSSLIVVKLVLDIFFHDLTSSCSRIPDLPCTSLPSSYFSSYSSSNTGSDYETLNQISRQHHPEPHRHTHHHTAARDYYDPATPTKPRPPPPPVHVSTPPFAPITPLLLANPYASPSNVIIGSPHSFPIFSTHYNELYGEVEYDDQTSYGSSPTGSASRRASCVEGGDGGFGDTGGGSATASGAFFVGDSGEESAPSRYSSSGTGETGAYGFVWTFAAAAVAASNPVSIPAIITATATSARATAAAGGGAPATRRQWQGFVMFENDAYETAAGQRGYNTRPSPRGRHLGPNGYQVGNMGAMGAGIGGGSSILGAGLSVVSGGRNTVLQRQPHQQP